MLKPSSTTKETVKISFLTDEKKRNALDKLADVMQRDRTYVLNEAIAAYLDVQEWQLRDLKLAIQEAEAQDFATEAEVAGAFAQYTHSKQ